VTPSNDSPKEASPGTSTFRVSRSDAVLSLALLAAFSLSLLDLASHWLANPWSRYSLVFIPLVAWVAYNEDYKQRHPKLGALMILAAMLIQLLSAKTGFLAVSRPALAFGLVGFLLNRGFASKRCALLALFAVPIPYSLATDLGGLQIAEWLFATGAGIFGIEHAIETHVLIVRQIRLPMASTFAGLPLFVLAVGLSGYFGLRRQMSIARTARFFVGLLLAAIPIQIVAVALSLLALAQGHVAAAEAVLSTLVWILPTALVVAHTERNVPQRRS
jgi:hypothetical protein